MGDSQPQVFSVRIVSIEHYTVPPIPCLDVCYSSFHGGRVKEVPVIRIYGSTPAGQKACLHVHQVLPYLYIPCSDLGAFSSDGADSKKHSLSLALEKALQHKGNAGPKRQHVHGCDLVRAKKFYGYHPLEELFVKIYFYHPQDVSRAASLLLSGAVLDRVLQPYESHIPYLLQFLIEYNLYGMSHLHASRVKFRNPVPDVFSHRKTNHNHGERPIINYSNCMDFQADLGGGLCLNAPIWISSTIPNEWIWQYSSQPDSSTNEDALLYKRQSTLELEADAVVHDIINQRSISFTPLSQANADTKMVQSLLPIWEEEYARNGVPETIPFDSHKPSPLDALKFMADGFVFEDLMQVQNVVDGCLLTPEPTKSSADSGDPTDSGIANLANSNHLPSKYLEASDQRGSLLALDSPFQIVDAAETRKVDASGELLVSNTMIDPTSAKDGDEDALRLLNWLASSQAAEDINSDDELARETILSPFLPSKEISRVLERATVEYESESQKECQDILDSVDMLNFEEANHGTSNSIESNHTNKFSLNKIIPQVDGSTDDPLSNPSSSKPHNTNASRAEDNVEGKLWPELHSHLNCNPRRKRPRWGSIPVSSEKVNNLPCPDESSRYDNKKKEWSEACRDEAKGLSLSKVNKKNDENFIEQGCPVVECSTRDLMRRKRSHRGEHPQFRSQEEGWQAESCIGIEHVEKETSLDPHMEAKCYETDKDSSAEVCSETSLVKPTSIPIAETLPLSASNNMINARNLYKNVISNCVAGVDCGKRAHNDVDIVCSSNAEDNSLSVSVCADFAHNVMRTDDMGNMSSSSTLSTPLLKNACTGESLCQTSISMCKLPDTPAEGTDSIERRTNMQFECPTSHCRNPDLAISRSTSKVNEETESTERIGMTTFEKPPTIGGMDDPDNGESNVGTSLYGRPAIDSQLVSKMNSLEEKLVCVSPEKCYHTGDHEPVMGVPVIYQNDGSCLYMLTPPVSPPSRESVEKWLSTDYSNVSPFRIVLKGFSDDMINSQSSQCEDCPLPEPTSIPNVMPNSDQQTNCNQESCSVKATEIVETRKNISPGHSQDISQISGPDKKIRLTPLSQTGFRDPASVGQGQQLTLLSIEVQAESRGDLRPDPRFDAVNIIVLVFQEDDESNFDTHVLLHCNPPHVEKNLDAAAECKVFVFTEETHLFNHFTKVIHASDPDVLMGWDVQSGSLGFLAERAAHLGIGLLNNISRTPTQINLVSKNSRATENELVKEIFSESVAADAACLENTIIEDEWGRTHASGVHVGGRIVLNVWRLMRNEVKLNIYTVEAVAETVLRRKIPHIPWKVLTKWFSSGPGRARYRSLDYTVERAKLNLQIMNQLDMINRTSELARVFGIDFFSVLSRGSQYRVESMFLRLAHTQNYLAISPGNQQVANQPAMECLPLVMEPESRFYADPVIVLDFQSLYPSMVIAYNLCFCTCQGKIIPPKPNALGVSSYSPDTNILRKLKHELLFTPNGVVYVPSQVRKGILPRLLEEILSTRIMVKQAMKKLSPSQIRHRILNARQLALKLIANVTYGYAAAGFSGRMPCAELADSIVQCGRRTLETAISFVNSNEKWKARVIYGDTDSMFVLLKGRSLQEAFTVGREIASTITEMNPSPVVLKMEKVYYPCFLLTKKRYVGYSYESPAQNKPTFDAKGIETIRRDTCGVVSKMMEQSLKFYFESQDIDRVKTYVIRQWMRIVSGRVSLQDFIFAKEVRLGTYSERSSSLPPAAIVATKAMRADPRAEPRYAERVPYVVVHGEPGARLVDMVVNPLELLALDSPYRLNDIYYIRKQIIPALQRVFGLIGADLNQWFFDMPRPAREAVGKRHSLAPNPQRTRIDYYYASKHCILCSDLVQGSAHLCPNCSKNEMTAAAALTGRTSKLEKDIQHLAAICRNCGGGDWIIESGVKCTSLACSIFYERSKVQKELRSLSEVATKSGFYPKCMVERF